MFRPFNVFFIISSLAGCVTVTQPATEIDTSLAAQSRIELGFKYLESGDSAQAKPNFERAMQFAPRLQASHVALAYYYQSVGEYSRAQAAYRTGIATAQYTGDLHNNYGVLLCAQGEFREAQSQFLLALAQPHYYEVASTLENAGLCALQAQNVELAFDYFSRALEHQPQRFQSTLQLAKLEIAKGDQARARLRLHEFHQRYGYQRSSISLLIELEQQANNWSMVDKYTHLLERTLSVSQQHQIVSQ